MKNPIRRLIHRYTYDMRLKTKLVISHIILILLPTAVLSGFFFLRIYDIVMKDSIRSEQVLSAQTVNSTCPHPLIQSPTPCLYRTCSVSP